MGLSSGTSWWVRGCSFECSSITCNAKVPNDQYINRYPYKDPPFPKEIDPKENTIAFGARALPKLVALLTVNDDLEEKEKITAINNILDTDLGAIVWSVRKMMSEC
jgi:hypothetical protein